MKVSFPMSAGAGPKWDAADVLGSFHRSLQGLPFSYGANAIPHQRAVSQYQERKDRTCGLSKKGVAKLPPRNELEV